MFAHFARDMRKDFVAVRQRHPKHGPGQHLRHGAGYFNWFLFSQASLLVVNRIASDRVKLAVVTFCRRGAAKSRRFVAAN